MLNFNNASNITVDGKEAKKIEINDVVVWEKINIVLSASSNSVYWGQNVTLTGTVSPAVEGLEVTFSNGVTGTTNANGVVTTTVSKSTPQSASFTANCKGSLSNSVSVTWNKRNLTISPLHTGTLYYGHYLRYKVTDSVSGSVVTGLSGYIVDGYSSTQNSVTLNSSGYVQKQLNNGTKTSTTSTSYSGKCKITGNSLYNTSSEYSASYTYCPSKKYNASLSSASTGTGCTATFTSGKYYGRWYPSSDDYTLVEALKGTGTARAYLASASGSGACKRPEELYVNTNGKNGTSAVSGTVLVVGYYIGAKRGSTVTVKFNNIAIQLYSNSEWTTKATASRTTTFPTDYPDPYYTGTFSFVPTMSQLTSGYIRLMANFTENTQSDTGYVYVGEFYPQVWYSPTQTFKS